MKKYYLLKDHASQIIAMMENMKQQAIKAKNVGVYTFTVFVIAALENPTELTTEELHEAYLKSTLGVTEAAKQLDAFFQQTKSEASTQSNVPDDFDPHSTGTGMNSFDVN